MCEAAHVLLCLCVRFMHLYKIQCDILYWKLCCCCWGALGCVSANVIYLWLMCILYRTRTHSTYVWVDALSTSSLGCCVRCRRHSPNTTVVPINILYFAQYAWECTTMVCSMVSIYTLRILCIKNVFHATLDAYTTHRHMRTHEHQQTASPPVRLSARQPKRPGCDRGKRARPRLRLREPRAHENAHTHTQKKLSR